MSIDVISHGDLNTFEKFWLMGLEVAEGWVQDPVSAERIWQMAGGSDYGLWLSNLGAVCSLASFSSSAFCAPVTSSHLSKPITRLMF